MGDLNNFEELAFHKIKKETYEAGVPDQRGEKYSIMLKIRPFWVSEDQIGQGKSCVMKDAQSVDGFGGHLENMVCPRKIIADGETQRFD